MGAKGVGHPIGFMGSLSDTLTSFIPTRVQGVQGCNCDQTFISSVIGNIQFFRISDKVNYYRLLSLNL